jgi:hypothetical protein
VGPVTCGRHAAAGGVLADTGQTGGLEAGETVTLPRRYGGRYLTPMLRGGAAVAPVEVEVLLRTLAGLRQLADAVPGGSRLDHTRDQDDFTRPVCLPFRRWAERHR